MNARPPILHRRPVRRAPIRHLPRLALLVLALALVPCGPSWAQPESRAATVAAAKAEKAKALQPPEAGLFEKLLNRVQEEVGAAPMGFYPYFGNVYSSGWVALGAGYRHPLGETGVVDLEGAYSLRGFWRLQQRLRLPRFARDRVSLQLRHTTIDASKVNYFGIGPETTAAQEAQFGLRRTDIAAEGRVAAGDRVTIGADLAYDIWNTREGSGAAPSIETLFSPESAPGLEADPHFVKLKAFVDVDWRDAPNYTRRGGYARASVTQYHARDDAPYDFTRLDLAAAHHVPLYRENWVLAFRGLFSATSVGDRQSIPFFLLPMLGESSDELRGYPTFRFRDRHRLLLTGEYRWMPSHYLDLALFLDAGTVAPKVSGLDLSSLKTAWGVSARLHTRTDTLLHATVGRSREGWRIIVGAGQVF